MHDPTKVLMGQTASSVQESDNRAGVIEAGLCVRLKSDDTITTALADGSLLGVSMGRSLSATSRTAICRKGLRVPVKLASGFTAVVGDQVAFDDVTGESDTAGAGVTACNAIFVTANLTGIDEDGADVDCALVDFPGGL